ncbi:hypothetical protein EYF80_030321 [Liparis tanakae]|uniref:Uncharacterized protein n=1 Tax=Liparis tanakae TaxID=230148 RepID=A0A4Z2H169_9TELE|nr:hypothetical protein EYF80_030321 [Liparis tanakae]
MTQIVDHNSDATARHDHLGQLETHTQITLSPDMHDGAHTRERESAVPPSDHVLPDVLVGVFEAGHRCREDLRLDHHLRQAFRVFTDLTEGGEHLSLDGNKSMWELLPELMHISLGIWAEDHLCQMCNGSIVHHSLGEFRCVLGDVAEGGGRDAFEGHLRLQKTQHQQGHGTGIHDRLRQGCTHEEDQRVDQLGQDVLLHHHLGQVIAVVCQAAHSQSRRLLNAGDRIQHEGAQH